MFLDMTDDQQLIDGCLKHDRKAQQELYEKYSRQMLGWCMRYAADRDEAEDMLQEALIRAFLNIEEYKGKGSFGGWLRKLTVNTAINHYQRNLKYRQAVDLEDYIVNDDTNDSFDDCQFTSDELYGVLNALPAGYRIIFNLYAIEGYKHKEIAKQLNIDVGTSKSQYSRAKALIREKLNILSQEKKTRE